MEDGKNPPDEVIDELENDRFYRWCTYALSAAAVHGLLPVLLHLGALGFERSLQYRTRSDDRCVTAGIGINTAHELGHKKESVERLVVQIVLAQSAYGHFYLEHNRGHHVRVSTPEDPATSRFGETLYGFWPRSVGGGLKSAWHLEKTRFERLGTTHWSIKNDVLNAWLMSVVLFGVALAVFGIWHRAVPRDPGVHRVFAARSDQLPRALRTPTSENRKRTVRAMHAGAQLEQ